MAFDTSSNSWKLTKRILSILLEIWRYVFSTSLLLFALATILYSMITYKTTFYPGVPNYAQIILLFVLLILLGTMEGTMMALNQLRRVDPELYKDKYLPYITVTYARKGDRVERFLNGRQVIVVLCGFQLAYLTTIQNGTLDFYPYFLAQLFYTGLMGSLVVFILGQITPQVFAAKFPTVFLSNPILFTVFRICLIIELTGLTYSTWAIVRLICFITRTSFNTTATETDEDGKTSANSLGLFDYLRDYLVTKEPNVEHISLDVLDTEHKEELPILINDTLYASRKAISRGLATEGLQQLSFLLPQDDENYKPAHLVASALLIENEHLQSLLTSNNLTL